MAKYLKSQKVKEIKSNKSQYLTDLALHNIMIKINIAKNQKIEFGMILQNGILHINMFNIIYCY